MAVRRLAEHQPESFAFSPENRAWAETTIGKFPEGRQASAVIALLWRAQEQEGWVTKPAIENVAAILGMPPIRVLEVATFYTMFHLEPVGTRAHVQVCGTTPCMLRGSGEIIDVCRRRIHHDPHHRSADGAFSWEEVECLGACVNAPMVQIFKDTYEDLTPESFEALLDAFERGETPMPGPQNGRHSSTPITGLTTLTEIAYAADDMPRFGTPRRTADAPAQAGSVADVRPGEPRTAVEDNAGGEELEAEQRRRKGLPPPRGDGADPAAPEAAHQEKGRVDDSGRSDEAALREQGGATATQSATSGQASEALALRPNEAPSRPAGLPTARDGRADDLKRIVGIGPVNERKLNALGIWHFDQIAAWSSAEAAWVGEHLSFPGRIERERWVEQGRKLVESQRRIGSP